MRNRVNYVNVLKTPSTPRHFKPLKYPEITLSIDDIYVKTVSGDRLDLLANQFYNDTRLWWIIATANMNVIRRDSFNLKAGLEIRIPADIQDILSNFESLNNTNGL